MVCPEGQLAGRSAWRIAGHRTGDKNYLFKTLALMDGKPANGVYLTDDEQAVSLGIRAIQHFINFIGYRHPVLGPIPITGIYGPRTKWGVQWFQKANGLTADGIFGPVTARALFIPWVRYFCTGNITGGVPVPLLPMLGMIDLESGFDPGAVSTCYKPENGPDRGLCQINKRWHPEISDAEAFDPFTAIPYSIRRHHAARLQFAGKGPDLQTNCAIAQHNNPAAAEQWYEIGWVEPDEQIAIYVERILVRGAYILAHL